MGERFFSSFLNMILWQLRGWKKEKQTAEYIAYARQFLLYLYISVSFLYINQYSTLPSWLGIAYPKKYKHPLLTEVHHWKNNQFKSHIRNNETARNLINEKTACEGCVIVAHHFNVLNMKWVEWHLWSD